ncbi:MAG: hypothetical protein PHT07_03905 [Paludibacter sp.]|nr:hypothetical protein [Paludibacter sp.]
MPIDFFNAPCAREDGNCKKEGVVCIKTSHAERFGISDVNSDKREPAYLDIENEDSWDLAVMNPAKKLVTFKAIDFCVELFRPLVIGSPDRELIKRCEGMIFYEDKLIFIEIKNRQTGRWLIDAREKFEETIMSFRESHPDSKLIIQKPIIANRLFKGTHQNEMVQKRILKDSIGLDFILSTKISIE